MCIFGGGRTIFTCYFYFLLLAFYIASMNLFYDNYNTYFFFHLIQHVEAEGRMCGHMQTQLLLHSLGSLSYSGKRSTLKLEQIAVHEQKELKIKSPVKNQLCLC